jgi:hypothetical protein
MVVAVVPKQATEDGDDDDLDLSLETACGLVAHDSMSACCGSV